MDITYKYGVYVLYNKENICSLRYPKYVTKNYDEAKQLYDEIVENKDNHDYMNVQIYDYDKSVIVNEYDSIDDMC